MSDRALRRLHIRVILVSTLVMAVIPAVFVSSCDLIFWGFWSEKALDWITMFWYSLPFTVPFALLLALLALRLYRDFADSFISYLFAMLAAGFFIFLLVSSLTPVYENADRTDAYLFSGIEASILAGSIVIYAMNERFKREQEKTGSSERIGSRK